MMKNPISPGIMAYTLDYIKMIFIWKLVEPQF